MQHHHHHHDNREGSLSSERSLETGWTEPPPQRCDAVQLISTVIPLQMKHTLHRLLRLAFTAELKIKPDNFFSLRVEIFLTL